MANIPGGDHVWLFFGAFISIVVFVLLGLTLRRDIKFYSANSWDLKKDSGVSMKWGTNATEANALSAKQRFYFAYPLGFLVSAVLTVVFISKLIR